MHLPLTIRASSSDRTFTCGGSMLLSPRMRQREREDGDDGELLHYLIAVRAIDKLGALAPEGGLRPPRTNKKVPAFTAWIVDWAERQLRNIIPSDWSLLVEAEMAYQYTLPRPVWVPVSEIIGPIPEDYEVKDGMVCIRYVVISGHMDILAISPCGTKIKIVDWKTGPVGADPAESNWQGGSYIGLSKCAYPDAQEATFYLAQPLIDEDATGIKRVTDAPLVGAQLDRMNVELAERACVALETRYTTDSGDKQCRWCPVALTRPWDCPSLKGDAKYMKAQIDAGLLEALQKEPDDAALGDFVLVGRTLAAPVNEATELLHERLDQLGYVDAGCGRRITRKIQKGDIKILEPVKYFSALRGLLQTDERIANVVTPSKTRVIDEIAEVFNIHKTSEKEDSATARYEAELAQFTEQQEKRLLVIT